MLVQRLKTLTLAGLAVIACGSAYAADYSPPPAPPPEPCCENWYLRGQIGTGLLKANLDYNTTVAATLQKSSNADSVFIGGGVGYEWNSWLRFDVTAEYRTKSRIDALVTYAPAGIDQYQGYLKSWVFLGNAYVDLGTWDCFTPFIGVGIGTAYNTVSDFVDVNPNGGFGFGRNPSKWDLAWALHAGVAYNVSKNFKVELAYRYLNYGSVTDTVDCVGGCTNDTFKYKLQSHDIMLGMRWTFCCELPLAPQQQYISAPAPVYSEPPLRSRG